MNQYLGALALLCTLCLSQTSQALPLLAEGAARNFGSAPGAGALLTLYPDHQNPNLFYYMPDSSEFTRTTGNLPHFGLTLWGNSTSDMADDGGFMVFQMRLKSSADQIIALRQFQAQNPGKGIAVLPIKASSIGLSSTNIGQPPLAALFSELNFPPRAGLAEAPVAISSTLTAVGARVFTAAINNPAFLKFDYCYKIDGLGPNFDATITANMQRVYDHLRATASAGFWFTRAEVSRETERLRQTGAVNIQINGGSATDEEYVRGVADRITARLFQPEISMRPGAAPTSSGSFWSFSRVQLQSTHREELRSETWSYVRRDLVEREFCVPMLLSEIQEYKDQVIQRTN